MYIVLRTVAAILLLLLLLLLTVIGLSTGGSGYFTCIQSMKLVTNKLMSGGLYEKHAVATVLWVMTPCSLVVTSGSE